MEINGIGLTMQALTDHAKQCLELQSPLVVLIDMPGFESPEMITNPPENIEKKIDYYRKTYDENCHHKYAEGIRIVAVAM